ncbi:hypothetical protein Y032_0071g548 [Ancylostoma ceylanicum]|uniref:Uncharacterized protein n=1 Tax=Ancylostoma ceylanicum TaxID=53326 RepID=A0A016TY10_9BILA|nr:hypothetical protein Y032_0071g548 [Ancylostoma ceylanicum]
MGAALQNRRNDTKFTSKPSEGRILLQYFEEHIARPTTSGKFYSETLLIWRFLKSKVFTRTYACIIACSFVMDFDWLSHRCSMITSEVR